MPDNQPHFRAAEWLAKQVEHGKSNGENPVVETANVRFSVSRVRGR